jgi:N-acetyl-gamma-glutamyl-phosphate reductase
MPSSAIPLRCRRAFFLVEGRMSAALIPTAIVGVTGYEGANLARLVATHPQLRLVEATARQDIGSSLGQVLPALAGLPGAEVRLSAEVREAALVFIAAPHGPAGAIAAMCRGAGRRVVDLSADFRLPDTDTYTHWYHQPHPAPDLLPSAVYGLPEWRRAALRGAELVANPGCFPTATILALAPAVAAGMILPEVVVDAKTAISGAGRSPSRRVHFNETHDSVAPYSLGGHRHLPEMELTLAAIAPTPAAAPQITFVPHLVPMNRGLLATCYATLAPTVTAEQCIAAYQVRYASEPFIQIIASPPETAWVRGSNRCLLHIAIDERRRRVIISSAIDNLMKGGAGQAIQNANLMLGLSETAGLEMGGLWP